MDISSPTKSQAYGAPDIWPWPQIDAKKSQTQTQLPFSQHSDKAHAAISLYEIYCRKNALFVTPRRPEYDDGQITLLYSS
jgi:hypothetical protein